MTGGMLEEVPCAVCGNDDADRLWEMDTFGYGASVLRRCRRCGLLYYSPRLSELALERVYSGTSEAYDYTQDLCELNYTARRARRCIKLIRKFSDVSTTIRLLDVGCGFSFFLLVAKQHGWEAVGVEPAKPVANFAREQFGLQIIASDFENAELEEASFDVVMFHHVLEHLRHPKWALCKANHLLRSGGLLVLSLPNAASLPARLAGREWICFGELHLHHFTPMTLSHLLKLCGFKPIHIETHHGRILWDSARVAANALSKLGLKSGASKMRGRRELSRRAMAIKCAFRFASLMVWMPLLPFVWLCYRLGFGPDLWICARKESSVDCVGRYPH
ncbi:MAG: class I SAM-dependent methyltransferase [Armatimonadota bacterium]|nr:class I SAM-dependent methyltransferase [Armatimonadota bacterium]MCX7777719.1 class I SAM-dependent methyltransferase [Armatimonadota bacterium]MDW8025866.1 class I SAM-dependent methyltransferase [Armatimonadota bacterium]